MLRLIQKIETLLCLCVATVVVADLSSEYNHEAYLDPDENYKLYWSVKDADKSIHFATEVKTTGWVGFGISVGLTGSMKDADIVMGWVDSSGKPFLEDYHGIGNSAPVKDKSQDYELIGGSQSNGKTILKFKRKILACDPKDRDIPLGTTKVIYAYGTTDKIGYHSTRRGARSLSLLNYVKNKPVAPTAKFFDIKSRPVSVPTASTTYWCESFKLDHIIKFNKKQHIIEIAPLVEKKDRGVVHHIVLYSCQHNFDERHLNATGLCSHPNMPSSVKECAGNSAVYAWAVGGVNFKFPDHVGVPVGTSDSMQYLVLQIHFDNPQKSDKFVVSTGFRLYYDNPRQYDAETLATGIDVTNGLVVPPEQKEWITKGQCSKECSAKIAGPSAFNGNEIRFFASFPHAHTVGKGIVTTHVRNGEEIREVFRDDSYDFDYQQTYLLNEEITFKAGDELMTYCKYDTMGRNYGVTGGQSTKDEMCLNFIMYYPRLNLTTCVSDDLGGKNFSNTYAKGPRKSNWTGVAWNNSMIEQLNVYYDQPKQAVYPVCIGLSATIYPMKIVDRVNITKKLPPKKRRQDLCTKNPSGSDVISFHASLLALPLVIFSIWFY